MDRFTDYMVKDVSTGECFRADHLLEASLERIERDEKAQGALRDEARRLLPTVDNMKGDELTLYIKSLQFILILFPPLAFLILKG